jgi:putative endonuclease
MWYLYITKNQNGAFYTGITTNLEQRIKDHKRGKGGRYTSQNKPIDLLYIEKCSDKKKAEEREQQIKRWQRNRHL